MPIIRKKSFVPVSNKKSDDIIEKILLGCSKNTNANSKLYDKDYHPEKLKAKFRAISINSTCETTKAKAQRAFELLKHLPEGSPVTHSDRDRIYREVSVISIKSDEKTDTDKQDEKTDTDKQDEKTDTDKQDEQ